MPDELIKRDPDPSRLRVFLAGSSGVLGRRIIPLLVASGHQVTALTRDPGRAGALRALGSDPVVGDVYDRTRLTRIVATAEADVVMDQLTDLGGGDLASNARLRQLGTPNLVAAARAAGIARCVAQSIAWAYEPGDRPAIENIPLDRRANGARRTTVRGVDALERAIRDGFEHWVILRCGVLYGAGTWYDTDGLMAQKAREGSLTAGADITSLVHVDDAAKAAAEALMWRTGTVNICDDEPAAEREWLPQFCQQVAAPPPTPDPSTPRNGWARGADNALARTRRSWTPAYPTWRSGLQSLPTPP